MFSDSCAKFLAKYLASSTVLKPKERMGHSIVFHMSKLMHKMHLCDWNEKNPVWGKRSSLFPGVAMTRQKKIVEF